MDDLALFGSDRRALADQADEIRNWCESERRLELRFKGGGVESTSGAFTDLGATLTRHARRPSGTTLRRVRVKARARLEGGIHADEIEDLARDWAAWMKSLASGPRWRVRAYGTQSQSEP